jgi:hypothetical protein
MIKDIRFFIEKYVCVLAKIKLRVSEGALVTKAIFGRYSVDGQEISTKYDCSNRNAHLRFWWEKKKG